MLLGVLPYAWSRQDIWLSEKEISHVRTPVPGVFAFMEHLQKKCCTCLLDRRCCVSHMDNIHGLVSAGGFLVQRVFTVCASVGKVCSITLRVLINTSPDGRGVTFPAGWKRSFNNLFPLHVGLSGGKTDLNNYQATVREQRPENSPKLQSLNCPNVCCATSRKEHVMHDINN